MINQPELFANVNQIPPTGLKAKKEQVEDLLEGLRRQVPGEKENQGILWEGVMSNFPWKEFIGIEYKMYKGKGSEIVYVKEVKNV